MRNKVLILADYFEPGYKAGGPIRSYKNLMEALQNDFEFYVITRNTDVADSTPYNVPVGEWIDRGIYRALYLPEAAITAKTLKRFIDAVKPSTIYLGSVFSWHLSIQLIWSFPALRSIMLIAAHGELAAGALSMKPVRKKIYLTFARLLGLYKDVRFHASSQLEANEISRHVACKKILVAPDLVVPSQVAQKHGFHKEAGKLRLCFVSRIVENKNLHFCIETLAELVKVYPDVSLDVYGTIENESYWAHCLKLIKASSLESNVIYKGVLLPAAVQETFRSYDFFYFPSMSENFGHVIFESLASGTPVIISDTTFWSNMAGEPVWGFIFNLGNASEAIDILKTAVQMKDRGYQDMSVNACNVAMKVASSSFAIEDNKALFRS